MKIFHTIGALLTLAALASYVNHKFLKLPATIGLMVIALILSLLLLLLGEVGLAPVRNAADFITSINFSDVLLHGMLAFLLFAGALHVDLESLRAQLLPVFILATLGLILATFLTGVLFWIGGRLLGTDIPFIYALLFGALIAPTDPIAVMGILKSAGAPSSLEVKIGGESLLNDGVAVVVFLTILGVATGSSELSAGVITIFLLQEAVGGLVLGALLGWTTYKLLATVDAYQVEILMTLALVAGGYALAEELHVSAPIAMVGAGLLVGNQGRAFAMSDRTREHLDSFWELIDEILNALLFMLIGLELVVVRLGLPLITMGFVAIVAVLVARFLSVSIPIQLMRLRRQFSPGVIRILTWGGLRGGISIALALSLPSGTERDLILTATYVMVVFSILVQGLTFKSLVLMVQKNS